MQTPTERTMRLFRKLGYAVDKAEHRVPYVNTLRDLFGFIDIVAIGSGIIGIQTTSQSNVSARKRKIEKIEAARRWLVSGGRILVVGWRPEQLIGRSRWLYQSHELVMNEDGDTRWVKLPDVDC